MPLLRAGFCNWQPGAFGVEFDSAIFLIEQIRGTGRIDQPVRVVEPKLTPFGEPDTTKPGQYLDE